MEWNTWNGMQWDHHECAISAMYKVINAVYFGLIQRLTGSEEGFVHPGVRWILSDSKETVSVKLPD